MDKLTALQREVLALYARGMSSPTELGAQLGFSRQRAQKILRDLRCRVLLSSPSQYSVTDAVYPLARRDEIYPWRPRRARQNRFVLRGALARREDGRDAPPDHLPADECFVTWTDLGMSRGTGWSWTAPLDRPWSLDDTKLVYRNWAAWLAYLQRTKDPVDRWMLPPLDAADWCATTELTRTIAWVIGVEALVYPVPAVAVPA